eukprot:705450-Lingulodinium_polyedra.AAC.1
MANQPRCSRCWGRAFIPAVQFERLAYFVGWCNDDTVRRGDVRFRAMCNASWQLLTASLMLEVQH